MAREVRVRQIPDRFDGKRWHTKPQHVSLVESKAWVIYRNAAFPNSMPRVMSRKEWDKLPVATPNKDNRNE